MKNKENNEVTEPSDQQVYSLQRDWGPIVNVKPVISPDSRYIVIASGTTVKILSTESGSLIEEHLHHQHKVIGVQPANEDEEYVSCDENGCVCFWKFQSKENATKYDLKENYVEGKVQVFHYNRIRKELCLMVVKGQSSTSLLTFLPPYGTTEPSIIYDKIALEPNKMAVSACGNHLAYTTHITNKGVNLLKIVPSNRTKHPLPHYTKHPISCLTFHPQNEVLATGHINGQVLLWYEFTTTTPTKMKLHWHHTYLPDLAFSSLGSYLYTGGEESVLVIWELVADNVCFVPRLGMPIKFVTADTKNSIVAVCQLDNAITIVKPSTSRVERVIQGFAMNVDNPIPMPAGIQYDSRTRTVVTNGRTGHVQFYDIHHNKQLYHLDITMSNYLREVGKEKVYNTEVQLIAVSPSGLRMATIESRDDGVTSLELRIKFWSYITKDQEWCLNTSIDMPHQKAVTGVIFQPTSDETSSCVTGSEDGKFKIWEEIDNSDLYGTKSVWTCSRMGFYRNLPVGTINFSPDASLIAASFEGILTFWEPSSCQLKGTLSQPYLSEKILQVEFGRGEGCRSLVVCRSENWLYVWDLLTCSLSWRVSVHSAYLAADPLSPYMAIFSKDCNLFIFDPRRSKLVSLQENACKAPPLAAAFIPRITKAHESTFWNTHSALLYISQDQTLHTMEVSRDIKSANERIDGEVRQLLQESEGPLPSRTPFAALLAATKISHVTEEERAQKGAASFGLQLKKSTEFIQKVLNDTRVYRLDSLAQLTAEFSQLVIPGPQTSNDQEHEDEYERRIKEKVEQKSPEKKKSPFKKKHKKDLRKVAETDFSSLMDMLSL
ncbi:hypothetical protein Pcinc_025126 [Petrolisthes cinctipes]|uniref:WD repeat-containing protein 75 second beta-propeller domain-containing protein n=1 Tax=Petrolisthes cinctipes TaxID=88211 RepID=A0AAE1KDG8_PETCI|nr:hypothetical protein Pcinc_025126 [Petrolisthes cinctipes]